TSSLTLQAIHNRFLSAPWLKARRPLGLTGPWMRRGTDPASRRREAASPVQRRKPVQRTLPNGWGLDGPRPCQLKPCAAPRLPVPEAGDQTSQQQTHPHEPEEHHSEPVVLFGVVQCSGG